MCSRIETNQKYELIQISLLFCTGSRLDDIESTNRVGKMTNCSLENLNIVEHKERSLISLLNGNANQTDLNSQTKRSNRLKELLSIDQLIANSTAPLNQLIDKSASGELVAKVKSNEQFLANLYNLSSCELIAIKQLITGYRESAAFLLKR